MAVVDLPGGLHRGRKLIVTGILKGQDCSFNLVAGHYHPHNQFHQVALHIAFRPHLHQVVFNATHDGQWGHEEQSSLHSVRPHVPFSLKISWKHDEFKVKVDKTDKHVFKQRHHGLHQVDKLFVIGACHIEKILLVDTKHH